MTAEPRSLIAETLSAHRRRPGASLQCECGHLCRYTGIAREHKAAHEYHVADAIFAALELGALIDSAGSAEAERDQLAAAVRRYVKHWGASMDANPRRALHEVELMAAAAHRSASPDKAGAR